MLIYITISEENKIGLIQNLVKGMGKNKAEFKEKFRQVQEEDKIQNLIEERKKSANRRELERHFKEKEEEQIKTELDKIRKKRNTDNWKTKETILGEKTTMLNEGRSILKEKNIFKNKDNMFTKKHAKKNKTDMGFFE